MCLQCLQANNSRKDWMSQERAYKSGLIQRCNFKFQSMADFFLKCSSILELKIDATLISTDSFVAETSVFKTQVCIHFQTRNLTIWPTQSIHAHRKKSTKALMQYEQYSIMLHRVSP